MLTETTGQENTINKLPNHMARRYLDETILKPMQVKLGRIVTRTDIKTTVGPFLTLPEYKTHYPTIVIDALTKLYAEYNQAFRPLVDANREWETDYQFCLGEDGTPINGWVQIDMVALPEEFLAATPNFGEDQVKEALRGRIFEIENSLAMYQLLENLFSNNGNNTLFKREFRASLDTIREKHRRPIALLAVTDQKYKAMRESEFGKSDEETLTDEEVKELSGFDKFFGPTEFLRYIEQNGETCDYLIYARTSDPISKLRKPDSSVEIPLLENDSYRRIIKANAITFNIDHPTWMPGDKRRINDTKAYLPTMKMAYFAESTDDLDSKEFKEYLIAQGVDPEKIASGEAIVRAKPLDHSYGGYGHNWAEIRNNKFRGDLRAGLAKRGPHVIQPEMQVPTITDESTGQSYVYIDRNFFSTDGKNFRFMGGFRSLMPINTKEAERGRVHGNNSTVWAEIN